jgi:hypothetical protein
MKTVIFGTTYEIAEHKLSKVINTISNHMYEQHRKSSDGELVVFPNNDSYFACKFSPYCRGMRYDRVFIDKDISREDCENMIFPKLCCSTLPKNDQIVWY